jgi:hypothetical protein
MARLLRFAIFAVCVLSVGRAFAAGGACPASSPVAGNNTCFFIAANGSDTNSGTSETSPWLHSPGMPSCSGSCATEQTSLGGSPGNYGQSNPGVGFIFRGGDTWHFGNSSASPYTGGTFNVYWSGSSSKCAYEGTVSGCYYVGVDATWYNSSVCGSSWCRPIFTGDNPASTAPVASCGYQTGSNNQLVVLSNNDNSYIYIDGFEITGLCSNDVGANCNNGGCSAMITDNGTGTIGTGMTIKSNLYFHGWTVTSAIPTSNPIGCTVMAGGGTESYVGVIIDGSDSDPGTCNWAIFPYIAHMKNSVFRYTTQGVATNCHDIHDNIFEHFYNPYFTGGHGNALECNGDAVVSTANVFYNNIIRHFDPSFAKGGQVMLWFCPNTTPEYWFNNLVYDTGGGGWDVVGPPTYSGCTNTGGQFMFNNTLVDLSNQPCNLPINDNTYGKYLTVYNEHLIGTPYDSSSSGGCTGGPSSPTNVSMSDSTATTLGFTTGSPGISGQKNTCANDTTIPCGPPPSSTSALPTGVSEQTFCSRLASLTSEVAIGTDAANACTFGTTDGCGYDPGSHTMICPAQKPVVRPPSSSWSIGAYQNSGVGSPTNGKATVSSQQ